MNKTILIWLSVMFCLVTSITFAQERIISGKVTDKVKGDALLAVTVSVKGTTKGTNTDADGNYKLSVSDNDKVLVFSFVGYKPLEVEIGNRTTLDVELQEDVSDINEVVVMGYGTQDKREVTSSVSRVSAETLKSLPVAGIDQALQGRAAGVQISTNSGTPGGGVSVRIRGSSSINASNEPLYVIDGVPMSTGNPSQLAFGGQTINALTDLNPADIESIEVLKDAASSAIYGSRASNGVVLITTKRGAANKTQFNFNAYYGVQEMWKKPRFLNRNEYLEVMTEAYINDGIFDATATGQDWIDDYYGGLPYANTVDTDWVSQVTRKAAIKNYELNVSGGNDKTKYFISANYFDQEGIVINSAYRRFTTRLNLDHQVNKKLSFSTSTQLSKSETNRIVSDNTLYGPFANSLAASPLWPVYEPGTRVYTRPQFFYSNPVAEGTENTDLNSTWRGIVNASAKYTPINRLNITARAGSDIALFTERRYTPDNYAGSTSAATGGSGERGNNSTFKWVLELFADYKVTLGTDHNFSFLAGTSRELNTINRSRVRGIGFAGEKFKWVGSAATINEGTDEQIGWGLESYFGRVNYAYKNTYILSANVRTDGSSRFGQNNRFGVFPAVSGAIRVSEFLKDKVSFLSELKVRASYGITGNQEIGNFDSRYLYSGGNYLNRAAIFQSQIPNPNLKWETTGQFDAGVDVGLFAGRINFQVDYYVKQTRDLLFNRPVASQNGFRSFVDNVGAMENTGIEFAVNTVNFTGANNGFRWTTDVNISFNKNRITDLYEGKDIFSGFGGNSQVLRKGEPIGTFYGLISDGVFSTSASVPESRKAQGIVAGDMNYRDINGDGVITDADFTVIGNSQPLFFGGLTNVFAYKGFDLNVFLQFVYGNKTWNASGSFTQGMLANFFDDNQSAVVLGRWRKEGDVTQTPRATTDVSVNRNNQSNTTRFVEDGSFLRVKNVILGYNVDKKVLEKVKLRSVRLYVQAQNLFTFTNYSGFDPEVNFAGASNTTLGTDFYTFPQARTYTVGINVGF
jgi:TonB-linked SusC/RagA family outer membrane protein